MTPLSAERIRAALHEVDAGPFGADLHFYASTGSTNDVLKELAADDAPEGTLVVADEQTAGRGRMGRRWEAPPGSSLLFSVLFRPDLPASDIYRLVMACGLAAAEACEAATGYRVDVKWPNDLQIGGKKLAGILPESAIMGERAAWVIVGVGLNVSQAFAPGDPLRETATSLRAATGQDVDRAALLAAIMARLNAWNRALAGEALLGAWRARCVTLGQRVRVETPGGVVKGTAEDITPQGALWLRDDAGQRHRIAAGEATLRTP